MLVHADHAAFEDRIESLNRVGMNAPSGIVTTVARH